MEDFNKYTSHINYSPLVDFALQQGKQVLYKKGEYFVRQGEICRTMGFVVSGSFRYCCTNSTGESSIVGYTFDGSFVGNYPAFQLEDQSNVDIQALCDSSVYMVTHQQLADFYETNNEHQKLGRRIAETLLWEVYDRMISMYSLTPEERYIDIITRCPDLLKLITLKELASYLLIRPETLSRIRRKVVQK
ncbi:Crp/Fnr family transcriptional regulator [Bacteroides congonensis]|uniref:Crp/Fnr family transcriptional regulator n=1 Tax=Bacteroides congonensis TaxID=1871006 RepID=UPI002676EBD6|nr:Crp/Fnr family transcriptional regulator [Bacteroides congonensis]